MKKLIAALLFFILLSGTAFSEVKKKTERWSNGAIREITFFIGTTKVAAVRYDMKGKKTEDGRIPDDVVREYYKSGKIKSEAIYKGGIISGGEISYYENGNLMSQCLYENGVQHGAQKYYSDNGSLKSTVNYINGKADVSDEWIVKAKELKSLRDKIEVAKDFKKTPNPEDVKKAAILEKELPALTKEYIDTNGLEKLKALAKQKELEAFLPK